MENTESFTSLVVAVISTWLILFFLNYRLAVYGKEQRGQKMWLSLLLGVGIGFFAQFIYNGWGINFKTPLKKWKANLGFSIAFIISLIIRLKMFLIYVLTFYLTLSYYLSLEDL